MTALGAAKFGLLNHLLQAAGRIGHHQAEVVTRLTTALRGYLKKPSGSLVPSMLTHAAFKVGKTHFGHVLLQQVLAQGPVHASAWYSDFADHIVSPGRSLSPYRSRPIPDFRPSVQSRAPADVALRVRPLRRPGLAGIKQQPRRHRSPGAHPTTAARPVPRPGIQQRQQRLVSPGAHPTARTVPDPRRPGLLLRPRPEAPVLRALAPSSSLLGSPRPPAAPQPSSGPLQRPRRLPSAPRRPGGGPTTARRPARRLRRPRGAVCGAQALRTLVTPSPAVLPRSHAATP